MPPEVRAGATGEGGVFKDEVDTGGDGFIKDRNTVGGEEEDALGEFELAEEDWGVQRRLNDGDAWLCYGEVIGKGGGRGGEAYLLPWSFARIDLRRCFCALRGTRPE